MNRLYPVLLLLAGFGLGWLSARYWDGDSTALANQAAAPLVTLVQPVYSDPQPDLAALTFLLQQDDIEAVRQRLEATTDQPAQQQNLHTILNQFLRRLQTEAQWQRSVKWLQPLLLVEPDNALWQDLLISAFNGLERPRQALELLFEARAASLEPLRRQRLMRRIETLLSEQLDWHRQQTPTHLTENSQLMGLLLFALEKQPDHATFGLMLAEVYEQSGDLEQALTQLQLIPYSEYHQAQVEESRNRIENKLSLQQRAAKGIALQPRMGQFVVTVVFDETVALDLMIDTGASVTALGREAVTTLNQYGLLHATGHQVRVSTANGEVMSPLFQAGRMRVGDWEMQDIELLQVNLPSSEIDGLLGMNFLGQFAFSIDQQQALLFLQSK